MVTGSPSENATNRKPQRPRIARRCARMRCSIARALPLCTAKIGVLHGRIVQQCCGLALDRDAAVFEHIATVGDAERGARVLLYHQHGAAGRAQRHDLRHDALDHQRRETERRLVEQAVAADATSARVRSPASAARRRSASARPDGAAPAGSGIAGTARPGCRQPPHDRCAHRHQAAGFPQPSCHRRVAGVPAPGQCPLARSRMSAGRAIQRPSNRMPPPDSATMPMTVLSNVLLPAPLAPISATISPLLDGKRHFAQYRQAAVAAGDAIKLQQRAHGPPSTGRVPGKQRSPAGPRAPDLLGHRQSSRRDA